MAIKVSCACGKSLSVKDDFAAVKNAFRREIAFDLRFNDQRLDGQPKRQNGERRKQGHDHAVPTVIIWQGVKFARVAVYASQCALAAQHEGDGG